MPRRRLTVLAALAAVATVLTLAGTSHAQTGRQWVALDQSPPGTPADVVIDRQRSDGTQSFFDIFVHGFYATPRMGPDQNLYYDLEVPGMGTLNLLGAPNLPAVQIPLALPMGVQGASLLESIPMDVASFDDVGLIWPQTKPEIDGAPSGTPEEFVRDDEIYRLQTPWPPDDGGVDGPARPMLGPIMGAMLELHPFRWTPATRRLDVFRHWQLLIKHEGDPQPMREPITRDRDRLATRYFGNWATVSPFFDINLLFYAGDYLIIREAKYDDELASFVSQKWARGFSVTEVDIAATGNTCSSIRTIIQDWYASTPANRDHYCLLVGDAGVIPLCTAPTGDPTDDLYASPVGNDLAEEVYLGRLSVDGETDLAHQLSKILAYENHGVYLGNYVEALLVAHKEDAPGKYVGAHESVRTAVYSDPPVFTTLYGHLAGVDNADVSAQINAGLGLVAYRGHGDTNEWWSWDLGNQSYFGADVNALANGSMTPVVWSFACTNHDLPASDCIGEAWLEKYPGGAVSSYGATVPSGTLQNHELDRQMFKAVYDLGLRTQSHAIEYGEAQMAALVGSGNAWMYNLLGDPDMQIRKKGDTPWIVLKDPFIKPCQGPNCFAKFQVVNLQGMPMPGIQVALFKPGPPGGPGEQLQGVVPEVFDNRYTDPEGIADIPAAPATEGFLYFTVQDESGNAVLDSIPVQSTTGVPAPAPARLQLAAHPTVARAGTFFAFGAPLAAPATVTVFDVSGRAVRVLEARAGAAGVRWEGDDENGRRVGPGVYHARLEAAGVRLMTRVVVLW